MSKNLAGRRVIRAQFHVGFGDTSRTGVHAEKDKAHVEIVPPGVYVKTHAGVEYLVPWSNVTWCHLTPDADEKPGKKE